MSSSSALHHISGDALIFLAVVPVASHLTMQTRRESVIGTGDRSAEGDRNSVTRLQNISARGASVNSFIRVRYG